MKIGIALAAYKPTIEHFAEQLRSIVEQTHTNWICHIQLDSSLKDLKSEPRLQSFFNDSRFSWSENLETLGAAKNFETAANAVLKDPQVTHLAFSDQDDIWKSHKLERCLNAISEKPPLSLVHSDMTSGKTSSVWKLEKRGVNHVRTLQLCIRNVVAGAGLLMDADLWRQYPKIPLAIPYHDRWAALIASMHGGVYPIHEALYEYRQHETNVLGITPYSGRFALNTANFDEIGRQGLSRLQKASEFWRTIHYKWNELNSIANALPTAFQPEAILVNDLGGSLIANAFIHFFSDPPLFRASLVRGLGKLFSFNARVQIQRGDFTPAPEKSNTTALIVTYQPDESVIDNLNQHAAVFENILVFDNASEVAQRKIIENWCAKDSTRRFFVVSQENNGVAEGHNQASVHALKRWPSTQWFAFFDQDSFVKDYFFKTMKDAFSASADPELIGIIGSNYFDVQTGKTRSNWAEPVIAPPYKIETVVITSGSLVPVKTWLKLGGYNKTLFIDHVDDEYCLRARSLGYRVIQPWSVTIEHRIGAVKAIKIAGKSVIYPMNQPAFRWRFVTRNFTWLMKHYFLRELPWISANTYGIFKRFLIMVFFESGRLKKIPAAIDGFRQGLKKKFPT